MIRNKKFLIVLFLSVIVYTANIGGVSIYFLDEAKNSGCAMAMYQKGEWIVPTFNDELRTDKPVLHYYFMKAGYGLFGINPLGARFFSALMGVFTVLTVFLFTRRIVNEQAAFVSSLILISSIQLAVQFHLAVPDPYLLFFLTIGWLSFYYGWRNERKLFLYLFYLAISLAFLTKGPVALVFSGLIVLSFLLSQRATNFRALSRLRIFEGALIFFIVGLPWYILVGMETHGEWIDGFFFKHNVSRFTSTMEGHGGFPFASFVILLAGLMPFSFFLPQTIRMIWKNRQENPFLIFCSCVAATVIVFFALSRTILPTYPEPAFAFTAILLGVFLTNEETEGVHSRKRLISGSIYLLVSLVFPVAAYIALHEDQLLADLAWLWVFFLVLPAGAVIALIYEAQSDRRTSVTIYSASMIVFLLLFFYFIFPRIDSRNSVSKSLVVFRDHSKPVMHYKDFNPAYVFAFQRPIPGLHSVDEVLEFQKNGDGFYIISEKKHLSELEAAGFVKIYEGRDLFENNTTIVVERRP